MHQWEGGTLDYRGLMSHCRECWALVVVVIVTAIHQIVTQTPYRYTTEISPNPQKMFCNGLEDEFARTNVILGVPFECV